MKATMIRAFVIAFSVGVLGTMAVIPRLSAASSNNRNKNNNSNTNQNAPENTGCCPGAGGSGSEQ